MFKVGDIVKVVRQPEKINSHINMISTVGFIEEIVGDIAQISVLPNGGGGGVDLDCLELETGEDWKLCKKQNEDRINSALKESMARAKIFKKKMEKIAKKHSISYSKLLKIEKSLNKVRY